MCTNLGENDCFASTLPPLKYSWVFGAVSLTSWLLISKLNLIVDSYILVHSFTFLNFDSLAVGALWGICGVCVCVICVWVHVAQHMCGVLKTAISIMSFHLYVVSKAIVDIRLCG